MNNTLLKIAAAMPRCIHICFKVLTSFSKCPVWYNASSSSGNWLALCFSSNKLVNITTLIPKSNTFHRNFGHSGFGNTNRLDVIMNVCNVTATYRRVIMSEHRKALLLGIGIPERGVSVTCKTIPHTNVIVDSHGTTAKCHIVAESGEWANNGTALEHKVTELLPGRGGINNRNRFYCLVLLSLFLCNNGRFTVVGLVAARNRGSVSDLPSSNDLRYWWCFVAVVLSDYLGEPATRGVSKAHDGGCYYY